MCAVEGPSSIEYPELGLDLVHIANTKLNYTFYRPQRSWGKVMFLQASMILLTWGSASVHAGIPHPPTRHPPGADTPPWDQAPPWKQTPPPPQHRACWEIRSTRGRYASYWNAILLKFVLVMSCRLLTFNYLSTSVEDQYPSLIHRNVSYLFDF